MILSCAIVSQVDGGLVERQYRWRTTSVINLRSGHRRYAEAGRIAHHLHIIHISYAMPLVTKKAKPIGKQSRPAGLHSESSSSSPAWAAWRCRAREATADGSVITAFER